MDTSKPKNQYVISKIRKKVLQSSLIEAFLESAPQLILQCSIIWRTGNISKFNNSINCDLDHNSDQSYSVARGGGMGHFHPPSQNCHVLDIMEFLVLFTKKSNFNKVL